MKLSTSLSHAGDPIAAAARARDLEAAGIDMLWVAELYGFDAVSILGFLAAHTQRAELGSAILPVYSRTPALIAMTAAGLDAVSRGRFVLGLGTSGPQVVEGWHGMAFDRPVERTREVIDICRLVWRRERLTYDGTTHRLPLPATMGTGLGKPLRLINHPAREQVPIYVAALGPGNLQLTAELADGWLPVFFHPEKAADAFGADLAAGAARRDPTRGALEIVAGGALAICSRTEAAARRDKVRPMAALYLGGMGAQGRNFYNTLLQRYGYEREAEEIQALYLSGRRDEAARAVPDDFLRATTLIGDEGFVRERIEAFREAGVTRLAIDPIDDAPLASIEKVRGWID